MARWVVSRRAALSSAAHPTLSCRGRSNARLRSFACGGARNQLSPSAGKLNQRPLMLRSGPSPITAASDPGIADAYFAPLLIVFGGYFAQWAWPQARTPFFPGSPLVAHGRFKPQLNSVVPGMKIHEFQAKEILRAAGVAVPTASSPDTPDEAAAAFTRSADRRGGQSPDSCRRPRQGNDQIQPQAARRATGQKRREAARSPAICWARRWSPFKPARPARPCARCSSKKAARSPASCTWASSSIGGRPARC